MNQVISQHTQRVVSIVLHYNKTQDTLECLRSLQQSNYANNETLVLDASGRDCDYTEIVQAYPDVQVIKITENRGYAGNNNVGITHALTRSPDWIFLLNNDTVVASDCIARMVEVGASNPTIGILGPTIYHFDAPDTIQSAGGILTSFWDTQHWDEHQKKGSFGTPHPVDWVTGCALLVRSTTIREIGYLDERFYLYWEEVDWCLRARKSDWEIWHVPDAKVWHKGAQPNSGTPAITYYSTRNRLLLLKKHNAPVFVKIYSWLQILRTLTSWSVRPKWRDKKAFRNAMWQGAVDFIRGRFGPMSK